MDIEKDNKMKEKEKEKEKKNEEKKEKKKEKEKEKEKKKGNFISHVGNPIINVNVDCSCSDHKKHDCSCSDHKKHDCSCSDHKKHDCSCSDHKKHDCSCSDHKKHDCSCSDHKKHDCSCSDHKKHDCSCSDHKKHDCSCSDHKKHDCSCSDHKKHDCSCSDHKKHDDCCCNHKKHDGCCCDHKKHDDCCCDYKKHDDCCCNHQEIERQVNDSANDVASPRITQSETSLAYYKNRILYGYNDFNTAGNISGFSFSSDLGKSWTDGGTIPVSQTGTNGGDPVIAVDRNGIFYYGQIGFESGAAVGFIPQGVISVSTGVVNPIGTITMNPPQIVGHGQNPINSVQGDQDKEWITVGPDAGNPGNEALYITWTDFTTTPTSIRFSKYTTGVNIAPLITDQVIVPPGVNNFVSGSFVVVDNLGGIYVFYEEITAFQTLGQPNRTIRMVRSIDGGNTFQPSVAVSNPFAAAATSTDFCDRPTIGVDNTRRIRMNEFPHAAIGPDGTIYVVWNAGTVVGATTFINVFLAYSQDQGNSWNQVNITNNSSFLFFPSVAANCEGAHIQYNRFNDPNGVGGVGDGTFGIFMRTFSLSNGLSEELMVSNQFSPVPITVPNPEPNIRCGYMGDYNQIISGPGSCLLHSWGDNRNLLNGQVNPNVFFKLTSPTKKCECGCSCGKEGHISK